MQPSMTNILNYSESKFLEIKVFKMELIALVWELLMKAEKMEK